MSAFTVEEMLRTTDEWKFRTKRERQRLTPYSRPNDDRRYARTDDTSDCDPHRDPHRDQRSLLNRISTSVKELLIPNWLRNTANFLTSNTSSNADDCEILAPNENVGQTNARADVMLASTANSVPLKPLTRSALNANATANVTSNASQFSYCSLPSTSSTLFPISELAVASKSDERVVDEQRKQLQRQSQLSSDILDADDGSSSTDATASSTSGCSSLVPSHSDNVMRLGLPLEAMRKELAKIKTRESAANSNESLINRNPLFSEKRVKANANFKQFSVSNFMSPSSILPQRSHFYEGKTVFGGANANLSRASRLAGTTPYSLSSRHTLAPVLRVQVNRSKMSDNSDQLSATSKIILEKLEKASTPLQDLRRMPAYTLQSPKTTSTFHQFLRPNKRPKTDPPIASLLTPSKAAIDGRNKPIKWELTQIKHNENDKLEKSCDKVLDSSELIKNTKNDDEGGGKMTRKNRNKTKSNEVSEDSVDSLLSAGLTMPAGVSLPKFNFGSKATFSQSSTKPIPTTVLTKVEDDSQFKFSSPVLKKQGKNFVPNSDSQSLNVSSFPFSSPENAQIPDSETGASVCNLTDVQQSNDTNSISSYEIKSNAFQGKRDNDLSHINLFGDKNRDNNGNGKKVEEKWVCECLFYNSEEQVKCSACHKERGSKTLPAPEITTTNLWAKQFKRAEGSWDCSVCMVNNKPETTKCCCCETPNPEIKNDIKKDSPLVDNWQCVYCKENNSSTNTCKFCKNVKKAIATKADLDELYGKQSFKFNAFKLNCDIPDNKVEDKSSTKSVTENLNHNQNIFSENNSINFASLVTSTSTTPSSLMTTAISSTESFKFGFSNPIESKPVETMPNIEAISSKKETDTVSASNLFKFGVSTTAGVQAFGIQAKDEQKTQINLEKGNEESKSLDTSKSPLKLGFQFAKPSEEKTPSFTFGSINPKIGSSIDSSLMDSKKISKAPNILSVTSNAVVSTTTVTTNSLPSFNTIPFTTASVSTPLTSTTTNVFNPSSSVSAFTNTDISKNLFTFGSSNKQFNKLTDTTTNPSTQSTIFTTMTAPSDIVNTTAVVTSANTSNSFLQNNLVFGNLNKNVTFTTSASAAPKVNFTFSATNSNTNSESSFGSSGLFGQQSSNKAFSFGNTPLNNSQTGFNFNPPNSQSIKPSVTSSTTAFGLNAKPESSNAIKANSLFTFGNQTTEPFGISSAPKNNNTSQFNFGSAHNTVHNASNNTNNNTNIFGNPTSSANSQSRFTINSSIPSSGFNFGLTTPQMMPSMTLPPLQQPLQQSIQQPLQQPLPQPPSFNFSQNPSFDFGGINPNQPVFQFSAEQNQNPPTNRNFKKAKRRLNITNNT